MILSNLIHGGLKSTPVRNTMLYKTVILKTENSQLEPFLTIPTEIQSYSYYLASGIHRRNLKKINYIMCYTHFFRAGRFLIVNRCLLPLLVAAAETGEV